MDLDPAYSTAYRWYAFLLTALGRHDEAIELATKAHELDPLSLVISTDLAIACYFGQQFGDAVDQLHSVLEVAPGFGFGYAYLGLAMTLSELGQHPQAVEAARGPHQIPECREPDARCR